MIFGDSDEEGTKDIDFLGIDEDDEESDEDDEESDEDDEESDEVNSESGNEGASNSDSEEEEEWWTDLSNIAVDKFSAQSGIVGKMGVKSKADDFFGLMFDEDLFEKIKEETHHYACMMFANLKRKLTLWVIMGMHILPKVADYWSTDIFQGNEGIKRVMPKIQFEEIFTSKWLESGTHARRCKFQLSVQMLSCFEYRFKKYSMLFFAHKKTIGWWGDDSV